MKLEIQMSSLERMVMESLQKSAKSIDRLSFDTGLNYKTLRNILRELESDAIIMYSDNKLSLNTTMPSEVLKYLSSSKSKISQYGLITKKCISNKILKNQDGSFCFKKVSMTDKNYIQLKIMMSNLELFINDASISTGPTKDEKIIYWGQCKYQDVIAC